MEYMSSIRHLHHHRMHSHGPQMEKLEVRRPAACRWIDGA
eukprot:CAMPEP_0183395428 /NCGR_PEP_ID=MMETSP0370-20130417/9308_1 /TAXON_ID=268820 /ORGANISM="Peridinium aciculiferum, Strain PAER-2" /LENGTH=39 /DNA_ID= /DNA_START= /DNA_END= /DNA_ORIENTATION=